MNMTIKIKIQEKDKEHIVTLFNGYFWTTLKKFDSEKKALEFADKFYINLEKIL